MKIKNVLIASVIGAVSAAATYVIIKHKKDATEESKNTVGQSVKEFMDENDISKQDVAAAAAGLGAVLVSVYAIHEYKNYKTETVKEALNLQKTVSEATKAKVDLAMKLDLSDIEASIKDMQVVNKELKTIKEKVISDVELAEYAKERREELIELAVSGVREVLDDKIEEFNKIKRQNNSLVDDINNLKEELETLGSEFAIF